MTTKNMFASGLAIAVSLTLSWPVAKAAEYPDTIRPSIRINAEYTDNRDALPEKEENTDFSFIPRVDVFLRGERLTLNFFGEVSVRYRTEARATEDDVEVYYDAGLNVDFKFSPKVDFRIRERYRFQENPAILDDGTTLRRDSSFGMNRAEVGVNLALAENSTLDVSGRHHVKMYDNREVARELDEEQAKALLSYGYRVSPVLRINADGAYENFDYESGRGMKRGYSAVSGGLSANMQMAANASGSVGVGYMQLDYDDSALGTDSSPYARATFSVDRHPGMRLTARGEYALRSSDVYPFVSQTTTSAGLDAIWKASARWILEAGGIYRLGDYDSDSAPVESSDPSYVRPTGGEETTLVFWGGIGYQFNPTTTLKLRQQYEDVDSDVSVTYTRNMTRLEIGKSF